MTQPIQPALPTPPGGHPFGYRLQALHLYNWGAFAGRHQAPIDVGNTAVIGPTGSGKTTLIDALMTLLCAHPRYNLASTGGHESDRDLVSYVRGASGPGQGAIEGEDDRQNHLSRSGRCVTGIAAQLAREGNSADDTVLIGAIFWLEGSSSSLSDLGRRWCFGKGNAHTLDGWLEEHHSGGARGLSRLEKAAEGLSIHSSKAAYLAQLQRFFEVGPNAFTLLNRAAGLKQLNSIDAIFRELVLDDHSAFEQALTVAASFDDLTATYGELELANRQHLSLLPLRDQASAEAQQREKLNALQERHAALPHWFAAQGARLWRIRHSELDNALQQGDKQLTQAKADEQVARDAERTRLEIYLNSGGGNVTLLEDNLRKADDTLVQQRRNQQEYQRLARNLGLDCPDAVDASLLERHQAQVTTALQQLDDAQAALQARTEAAVTAERNAHASLQALSDELQAVKKRPSSNLPSEFARFRSLLAEHLELADETLPFVAELVEVQKNQHPWRGAIERALGQHRLRILVPPQAMPNALRWVNQRHNQLDIRLLDAREPASPESFLSDGFARKLNLKVHPLQTALRHLLAEQDRHCVDHTDTLRHTPHAMTREGMMSGRAGHFDKLDQRRLDQNWMTGFDNRDRLAHLAQQISALEAQWQTLNTSKLSAQTEQMAAATRRQLWSRLQEVRFDTLDTASTQASRNNLQARLDALLDPQSDAAQAKALWELAQKSHETAEIALREQHRLQDQRATERARAEKSCIDYEQQLVQAPLMDIDAWDAPMTELLGEAPNCDRLERQRGQALTASGQQKDSQSSQLTALHNDIIRQMSKATKEDRGALTDVPQEVAALAQFLERLRVLEEEALPDKRQRFQEYLNKASDQGVRTLLTDIETQVHAITDRLELLNETLQRVDFQKGRYLQLHSVPVQHVSLQNLNKALAHLNIEQLRDDGGHAHYRALQAVVELLREHATNRRTQAAQALLDARYRLEFMVHVADRETGQVLERRTGSQGGSGGEKEIIASYVLTASLSYALCPAGRSLPLFSSIVLDEAFSKSSPNVAARIIQALREFGLHALFVTPNKELRLLRNHTRSAIVVHRAGRDASLTALSWEELDARARIRRDALLTAQP